MNDDSLSEAGTMWGQNCCLCSLCLSEIKIIYIKRVKIKKEVKIKNKERLLKSI